MSKHKGFKELTKFMPSIHQPLPPSDQELSNLLKRLKTSFRVNLNAAQWDPETVESFATKTATPTKSSPSSYYPYGRPTDRHLSSILSNPLFKGYEKKKENMSCSLPRDPMEVFDQAVSRGMMTSTAAAGCLISKHRQISRSGTLSVHNAMRDSMAASRVLKWLKSSGMEQSLMIIQERILLYHLAPFLVAEGLEEAAWEWAERSIRGEGPPDDARYLVASLIRTLAIAKLQTTDKTLDSAYKVVARADETWRTSPDLPRILGIPWRSLSWMSTVEAWKRPLPSIGAFESFVSISDRLRHRSLEADRAHLDLHHPTNPQHHKAVSYLHKIPPPDPLSRKNRTSPMARAVVIGIDAVSHLTRLGQTNEADELLRLLESKFSAKSRPEYLDEVMGLA